MSTLSLIFRHLDHFRTRFFVVFLSGLLDGAAVFLLPVFLSEFTRSDFSPSKVMPLLFWIIGAYAASLVFQWVLRRFGESLAAQFGNHIRLKYFFVLADLPMDRLSRHHSGYVLSLVNKITDSISQLTYELLWTISRAISGILLFFFFTARESMSIAVINLVLLIVFVVVSVFLSRKMVPIMSDLNTYRAKLLGSYADFMANILTVKRLGVAEFSGGILSERTQENFDQIRKLQNFHAGRWFVLHSLYGVALFSTIGFLLWRIAAGQISASVLILFIAAYTLIKGWIERISEDVKVLLESWAYLENLNAIVSLEAEKAESAEHLTDWESITFRNVSFQYPETLKQVSVPEFTLKRGEKICLSGTSGGGKTTFLNLLANFLESQEGERLVDGVDYTELSADFFRKHMMLISQDAELFNMSLRDNVTLGQAVSEATLRRLLEAFDLLVWADGLPDGLETIVGEKGTKLSAGQRQRINLLRGILSDRELLILDEPTSNLDTETEQRIVEFLKTELKEKTLVIVSHRDALFDLCDTLYTMEGHTLAKKEKE